MVVVVDASMCSRPGTRDPLSPGFALRWDRSFLPGSRHQILYLANNKTVSEKRATVS